DGFTDMLYSLRRKDGKFEATFYRNVANPAINKSSPTKQSLDASGRMWDKGNEVAGYKPPIPFGDEGAGDLGVRFADLDGDGWPDIIYARLEASGSLVHGWCKNDGTKWLPCQNNGGYTPPGDLVFVVMPGSFNGKSYSAQTNMQLFDV